MVVKVSKAKKAKKAKAKKTMRVKGVSYRPEVLELLKKFEDAFVKVPKKLKTLDHLQLNCDALDALAIFRRKYFRARCERDNHDAARRAADAFYKDLNYREKTAVHTLADLEQRKKQEQRRERRFARDAPATDAAARHATPAPSAEKGGDSSDCASPSSFPVVSVHSSVVENEAPDEYVCPITQEFMVDPVTCADGHSYERMAILEWLEKHDTSPKTSLELTTKQVFPAIALRNLIVAFREANPGIGV